MGDRTKGKTKQLETTILTVMLLDFIINKYIFKNAQKQSLMICCSWAETFNGLSGDQIRLLFPWLFTRKVQQQRLTAPCTSDCTRNHPIPGKHNHGQPQQLNDNSMQSDQAKRNEGNPPSATSQSGAISAVSIVNTNPSALVKDSELHQGA